MFFVIYLVVITIFLSSNSITITNAIILLILYIGHIFAMKWNSIYEVAIKKNVARLMEIRELTGIADKEIEFFHKNLNSRALTIETLRKLEYRVEDKHIVLDQQNRKRIKEPKVFINEEQAPFSMMDDRSYFIKLLWKKAAIKIIIRIQAYKYFEKIRRNKKSVIEL